VETRSGDTVSDKPAAVYHVQDKTRHLVVEISLLTSTPSPVSDVFRAHASTIYTVLFLSMLIVSEQTEQLMFTGLLELANVHL